MDVIKAKDKGKIECIVKYLKEENRISDESFNSVGHFNGDYQDCREIIKQDLTDVAEETKLRLNEMTGLRQYTNCVMNQLKQHEFYDEKILLSQVLNHAKISWKFWMYFERNSWLKVVKQEITTIEEEKVNYCVNNTETNFTPEMSTDEVEKDYDEDGSGNREVIQESSAKLKFIANKNNDLYFEQSSTTEFQVTSTTLQPNSESDLFFEESTTTNEITTENSPPPKNHLELNDRLIVPICATTPATLEVDDDENYYYDGSGSQENPKRSTPSIKNSATTDSLVSTKCQSN